MPAHRDDRTEKPSVIDLVTDPEKFDQWQRQREREEATDHRNKDNRSNQDSRDTGGRDSGGRESAGRESGDPRDGSGDRRS